MDFFFDRSFLTVCLVGGLILGGAIAWMNGSRLRSKEAFLSIGVIFGLASTLRFLLASQNFNGTSTTLYDLAPVGFVDDVVLGVFLIATVIAWIAGYFGSFLFRSKSEK